MRLLIVFYFVLIVGLSEVQAQPCDCGDGTFSIACCPPAPVPIGGLGILLGAGALLGVKRMLKNRKENA